MDTSSPIPVHISRSPQAPVVEAEPPEPPARWSEWEPIRGETPARQPIPVDDWQLKLTAELFLFVGRRLFPEWNR